MLAIEMKKNLTETYNPKKYPKYENYEAINVDKVKSIQLRGKTWDEALSKPNKIDAILLDI